MDTKELEEGKKTENVEINIKPLKNKKFDKEKYKNKQNLSIVKKESGVYHDGKRLLYEPDEEFKSCCFDCDKEFVFYIGKMSISLLVLSFSFLMLQNPANDVAFYTSTISLLLGHYLNQNTAKEKREKKEK